MTKTFLQRAKEIAEQRSEDIQLPAASSRNGDAPTGASPRLGAPGYAQAALRAEVDDLRATQPGSRNHQLNKAAFSLGQLVAGGELDDQIVADELTQAARDIGLTEREIAATLRSGLSSGGADPRAAPRRVNAVTTLRHSDGTQAGVGELPDTFWASRPILTHIRQAAWSRGRSAEAVLGAALARVAADTNHAVKLPATVGARCGLSLIAALCGPPGSGKSSSKGIAVELTPAKVIDPTCDDVPPGSGEGIIELLFDLVTEEGADGKKIRVKRQTRHNVFAYVDEGEILATQARRGTASTIIPTLRSVFTDGTLGQANASEERKRVVPGGHYVYGIVVGIQPDKAAALFEDAGGGTPQRFLWFGTATTVPPPDERPDWPGPLTRPKPQAVVTSAGGWKYLKLPDDVTAEIRDNDHRKQREGCDPLEEHADLLRLKAAAVLAVLDGRDEVDLEDWGLAGMIGQASNATRDAALAALARQREEKEKAQREKRSKEAVASDAAVRQRRVAEVARKIADKIWKEPERWTFAELRRFLGRDRDVFADAIDYAIEEGWAIEESKWIQGNRQGSGGEAHLLRPGRRKP